MGSKPDGLRDRLLAQQVPQANKIEEYRREVQAMLERNENRLRREKWFVTVFWFVVVASLTVFLLWMGLANPIGMDAKNLAFTSMAAYLLVIVIYGAIELLKHFVNRSRVEILKEVKGIEMQLLELREALRIRNSP
jgi:hypothetical protein